MTLLYYVCRGVLVSLRMILCRFLNRFRVTMIPKLAQGVDF